MNLWRAPFLCKSHAPRESHGSASPSINATVAVPGSKSLTNRYLILAALSEPRRDGTPIRLTAPLAARDTCLMAGALEALGVRIERSEDDAYWLIYPPERLQAGQIACGLAGTVMRFIPPVAALADGESILDGDAQARLRPMGAIIEGLRQLGISATNPDTQTDGSISTTYPNQQAHSSTSAPPSPAPTHLPIAIHGTGDVAGGAITIDASASSQFVSGLLLAGARFTHGLDLHHRGGELPSLPHISMTIETLRAAGVHVTESAASSDSEDSDSVRSAAHWRVEPGAIRQPDVVIEPDLSNAAPFLAAAMVTGGRVRIPHWSAHTTQPGAQLPDIFERMGAHVCFYEESDEATVTLELTGPADGIIQPLDMNLHAVGELVPTIAAVAAFACGMSTLRDIGQLRGHETDRLAALTAELAKIGVTAREDGDDLIISPCTATAAFSSHAATTVSSPTAAANAPAAASAAVIIESYADHRMATFGAILGLRVPNLYVRNIETTSKTLPRFVPLWEKMLSESGVTLDLTLDTSTTPDSSVTPDSSATLDGSALPTRASTSVTSSHSSEAA